MSDLMNMGGYGQYVWSAIGLTLLILVWNAWSAVRQLAHARRDLALWLRREESS